jgi:hypothetical protein
MGLGQLQTLDSYGRWQNEYTEKNSELDVGGSEWQSFLEAIKVRNRITHPKKTADLVVSQDDLKNVIKTFEWLDSGFFTLMLQSADANFEKGVVVSE